MRMSLGRSTGNEGCEFCSPFEERNLCIFIIIIIILGDRMKQKGLCTDVCQILLIQMRPKSTF